MGTTKTYGLGGGVAGTSEIEDNTDDAVLWKDTAGIEMFELDSTNGSGYVAISADTDASNGKPYLRLQEASNYFEVAANGYARVYGSANDLYAYAANKFEMLQTASTSWRIRLVDDSNFDLLVVDGDASNFTYTFHTDDSGVFKVSDSSGVDYLNIAEGGTSSFGRLGTTGVTNLYGSSIRLRSNNANHLSVNDNGSQRHIYINGSNSLNSISHFGAKTDFTTNTSHGSFTLRSQYIFHCPASGPSGTVTADADFITCAGLDATQHAQTTHTSRVIVANSNASHSFVFKLNVTSGHGAVAPYDSDSTNLTDGTGYTAAAGKVAVFEVMTVRLGGTGNADQIHMVRCVGKN